MVEQYLIWTLLVGIAIGAAAMWFALGRLPRRTDDVSPVEMHAEAELISQTIADRGGVAPVTLVEEVLELHVDYVAGEPLELEPVTNPDHDARARSANPVAGGPRGR